jgi:hypothetical protein
VRERREKPERERTIPKYMFLVSYPGKKDAFLRIRKKLNLAKSDSKFAIIAYEEHAVRKF